MKNRILLFITVILIGITSYSISATVSAKENLKEKVIEYSQSEKAFVPLSIFDIFTVHLN